MKKQTKIKNGFYKGFISSKEKPAEAETPKEQIVIVNQKEKEGFVEVMFSVVEAVFRVVVYTLLFVLSSVGLTALINSDIREVFIRIFHQ